MKYLACNYCGFPRKESEWMTELDYEYNGRYVGNTPGGGDHAQCPNCMKYVHIDYDLFETEGPAPEDKIYDRKKHK